MLRPTSSIGRRELVNCYLVRLEVNWWTCSSSNELAIILMVIPEFRVWLESGALSVPKFPIAFIIIPTSSIGRRELVKSCYLVWSEVNWWTCSSSNELIINYTLLQVIYLFILFDNNWYCIVISNTRILLFIIKIGYLSPQNFEKYLKRMWTWSQTKVHIWNVSTMEKWWYWNLALCHLIEVWSALSP